jgi:ribosomal protein L11 methyltransferase
VVPGVELRVEAAAVPVIEELFGALGLSFSSWTNIETGQALVWAFAESAAAAARHGAALTEALPAWAGLLPGTLPVPRVVNLRREDWATSWRRFFHAFRASRRLVVKPSWEAFAAGPHDIVLELDPGMCFGTGYHGTTRACLGFLDDLVTRLGPVSFLDVGCGSGILTLAAAKLGFGPLRAFDHDPQAVHTARGNLAAAGVTAVELVAADLAEYVPPAPSRVIVANVLATVLEAHRDRLCSWLDRSLGPGYLILSGVLPTQYPALRAAFLEVGCREVANRTLDEWTSGCFAVASAGCQVGCP